MKTLFLATSLLFGLLLQACSPADKSVVELPKATSVYMIGASIAYPENTWFEMGCEQLGLTPINRAVSSEKIDNNAVAMSQGLQYTTAELDSFEIFVIMHTHEAEICNPDKLHEDYNTYTVDVNMDYSQGFDYVIRRYADDCRALEFDEHSAWHGIKGGKPVKILLCTYWHDARILYNDSVRRLSQRWDNCTALCEFDRNVGFSKDNPDPQTGEQISLSHACNGLNDTEYLYGVLHGWHPTRGRNAEIQQRMSRIFAEAARAYSDI